MRSKQVVINRTKGEWDKLNAIAKANGKSNFTAFLRGAIWNLARQINECEKCVSSAEGSIVEKKYYISQETARTLELISVRMRKPIGAVINDIIISNMLHKKETPS
jgi:alkylhydroperoxidase family enzyme